MVTSSTTATFSLPLGPESRWALFLDLDGTLLDLCSRPERVVASREVIQLLPALQHTFDGAVVVMSGRPVRDIDRILFPLQIPCIGLHGGERRSSEGKLSQVTMAPSLLDDVRASLSTISVRRNVDVEDKAYGFAVHLQSGSGDIDETEAAIAEIAERSDGAFRVLRGRNVIELVPRCASPGRAVRAFLDESPFLGRRPLVFGDDATNTEAFAVASHGNGVAIAVGDQAPTTFHRVASPRECRFLLSELVNLGTLGLVA